MPIHALEDIDDALDATKAFLWPLDRSRWLKLALVAFFVGGPGTNLTPFQFDVPVDQRPPPGEFPALPDAAPRLWLLVGGIAVAGLLLGLLFLLIKSIMEFVFVESLRREEVALRQYWSRRWRQGVRLFGFRLVLGAIVLGGGAVLAGLFLLPIVGGGPAMGMPAGGFSVLTLLLLLPAVLVFGVLTGLISGFTTTFVVPIMILEDCGVIAGWRRLWSTIVVNPWQYLAYAVAGFVLSIAAGILVGMAVGVAVLLLLIPFGVLRAIGVVLASTVSPLGIGVLVVAGVLFVLSMLVLVALAQVPVTTYLRYYALLVLGDVDGDLDLVPERRAAIRVDGE